MPEPYEPNKEYYWFDVDVGTSMVTRTTLTSYEQYLRYFNLENKSDTANKDIRQATLKNSYQRQVAQLLPSPSPSPVLQPLVISEFDLISATKEDRDHIVDTLLRQGVNPNGPTKNNDTPLHYLCSAKVGKLFFAPGVNPPDLNRLHTTNNLTALMSAVLRDKTEVVKFLLEQGASTLITNRLGGTALSMAKHYKRTDVIRLLEAATQIEKSLFESQNDNNNNLNHSPRSQDESEEKQLVDLARQIEVDQVLYQKYSKVLNEIGERGKANLSKYTEITEKRKMRERVEELKTTINQLQDAMDETQDTIKTLEQELDDIGQGRENHSLTKKQKL